jgi:undecaprenyl-diphosphatase
VLSFLQAAILGILQGISELFPISSLGHSIILPTLLGWNIDQKANYFLSFLVATHFATAAVLFFFYWDDWLRPDAKLGWLLVIGTVPAGAFGLLFQKRLQELFASPSYVASILALNGILLYLAELLRTRAQDGDGVRDADHRIAAEVSWGQSAKIGLMQVLALIPGFSRTGSTLTGGLMVGLAREDAMRFSFLLATPIIAAAAVLKLPVLFTSGNAPAIEAAMLGAVCAAIASYLSVRFLTAYFKTRTLTPFAIYCLLFGCASMLLMRR